MTIRLIIISLLLLSASSFASSKKCILKVEIKIERVGNEQYEDCIGDSEEIDNNSFITRKKHIFKNISEEVCLNDVVAMLEDQEVVVPFSDSIWPIGFDPKISYCTGNVTRVLSIKYR